MKRAAFVPFVLMSLFFLVSACNALEKPTKTIPTVEIADRATRKVMPKTDIADPTLAPGMTFTPLPVPLVTATTSARSETRVFSTTLHVFTARTLLTAGEILTVTLSIRDDSVGCRFVATDFTLSQQNGDVFATLPHKVTSPGSGAVFTLTAVSSGTVTLDAYAFGEHNCGYYDSDWYWAGVGGTSDPISVVEPTTGLVPMAPPGLSRTPVVPTKIAPIFSPSQRIICVENSPKGTVDERPNRDLSLETR
jgi:hypothetical protein